MRELKLTAIFIILLSNNILSQTTVEDIIKNELLELLVKGDILNSEAENTSLTETTGWGKKKVAKLKLDGDRRLRKQILEKYPYPRDGKLKLVDPNLKFVGVNMAYLGSYLIPDISTVTTGNFPENSNNPQLPWLLSNSQVGITNPNRNNYNLFSNLTYLVSLDAKMGLGVSNPYFDNKAKTAVFKSQQNNQTLSIAYGTFNNKMASLFNRVKLKGQFNELEISPLLHLWQLYSKNVISGNESVLNSFEALSIYRTSRVSLNSKKDFSNESKVNISSIPFLQLEGNSNFNWSKERKSTISENTYNVYMTSEPTFEKIPTLANIMEIWETFSVPEVIYPEGSKTLSISKNNSQNSIKVIFGPLCDEFKNRITVNKDELINQMANKFVRDIKIEEITQHPNKPGYYILNVKFIRDNGFYESLTVGSPRLSENLNLKLFCLDEIGENRLGRDYALTLETQTLPLPFFENESATYNSENPRTYKIKLKSNIQSSSTINSATITNIEFTSEVDEDFSQMINSLDYIGVIVSPNNYSFNIEVPIDHSSFSPSSILTAKVSINLVENGVSYNRTTNVRLPYRYPVTALTESQTQVFTFASTSEIIQLLPDATELNNNSILSEYLSKYSESAFVESEAFDLLKLSDKEQINFLETGYFQVNASILDYTKLQLFLADME